MRIPPATLLASVAQTRLASRLVLLLALGAMLATGCTSSRPTKRDRELLALHPAHETRMSHLAEASYVPSGVWRIRGPHNTLYLGGTAHLVTRDQIPFPSPFYAAYDDSKEVYLEVDTDPSFFTKIRFMAKTVKWAKAHIPDLMCPKDRRLGDYLAPETVERLKQFYGKNYAKREKFTPLGLAFLGDAESISSQYTKEGGVEDVFVAFARKDGKPMRALDDDSVEDVALLALDEMLMEMRTEISRRGADAVVQEKILGERNPIKETVWRDGDLAAVERDIEEMKRESPALYEKIGPERNRKWMGKLKAALQREKNVMVLVGVDHLGGRDGLLQLLQDAGFTVERMYGVDSHE